MRLFSKVREGTAFDVGSQNSKLQSVQPVVRQHCHNDTAEEQQVSTEPILHPWMSSLYVTHRPCIMSALLIVFLYGNMVGHLPSRHVLACLLCLDLERYRAHAGTTASGTSGY